MSSTADCTRRSRGAAANHAPGAVMLKTAFSVPYAYPVWFTRGIFEPHNRLLADTLADLTPAGSPRLPCLVLLDQGLADCRPDLAPGIMTYLTTCCPELQPAGAPLILPGGEQAKNSLHTVQQVVAAGIQAGLCRQSLLWAVGGGAFLDAVGLAAALLHRGVRLCRFPSTVLSQNDSGVGVKNGVNLGGIKNLLGTFSPPCAVFNDLSLLDSLEDRDWIAGSAEAFKVAAIEDRDFLDWLIAHAHRIPTRDPATMEYLVRRCAELHCSHIAGAGDPFEFGSARPLDFGHWAAHKLESMSGFELRHGEAVAIGMALDLVYAAATGMLSHADIIPILTAMRRAGLPTWHPHLHTAASAGQQPQILDGIDDFREHLGGQLHVTFPSPLGKRVEVTHIDRRTMQQAGETLRELNQVAPGEV